jgi:transposase
MFEALDKMGFEVLLSHPLKTRAIADARIKSDKIDAGILSDLLRANLLPTSYIPPKGIRDLREILRHRMRLVRSRSVLKNRLRAILTKNNQLESFSDITGIKARQFMEELPLAGVYKIQIDDIFGQVDLLNKKIAKIGKILNTEAKNYPQVKLLTEISGIGVFTALLLIAQIGDINRFGSPKKLVRYVGLCPGLHQSGETSYNKSIVKDGDSYLRCALTESAQIAVRRPGALRDFFISLSKMKGHQKAIIAVARKMLTGIYFVLKEGKSFSPVRRKFYLKLDKPAFVPWS